MKIFKYIMLILLAVITLVIVILKPHMHKLVRIENTNVVLDEKNLDTNTKESKIAWNAWHSRLDNKILKDAKVPKGEEFNTVNFLQFNVDSNKNISNIKISTQPEKYSQIAKKHYLDYLISLNGNDILEFPKDSDRKVVLVKLSITTSDKTTYSNPKDFSDYETIRK
jgi:hypothetical protein